ncbi:MAG: hypothetical protein A3G75_11065 [Verrucomicrobia bacterium RIFCSPLOWO2_12_FULL_64_8]|nr:MAG: hypothetical protein A3G75_11065 [Verrucomicrobia bacterium RIFCSPLOWO2_12_FULL_64_8]
MTRWLARGPVVADTYGPPLGWLSHQALAWVKLNRVEFEALFPETERNRPMKERLAALLERRPVRAWIVSDGARPVWLAERGGEPAEFAPPKVNEISPTGSGDVLHACMIHAVFHHQRSLPDALTLALPYASANAAHPGVVDFPLNNLSFFGSNP